MNQRMWLLAAWMLSACGGGDSTPTPEETATPAATPVPVASPTPVPPLGEEDLTVQVLDQNGDPWAGIAVWIGSGEEGAAGQTDEQGVVSFRDVARPYTLSAHIDYDVKVTYSVRYGYNRIFSFSGLDLGPEIWLTLTRVPDATSTSVPDLEGIVAQVDPSRPDSRVFVAGGGASASMLPSAEELSFSLNATSPASYLYASQAPVDDEGFYDSRHVPLAFQLLLRAPDPGEVVTLDRHFDAEVSVVPTGYDAAVDRVYLSYDWVLPQGVGVRSFYDDNHPPGGEVAVALPPEVPEWGEDTLNLVVNAAGPDVVQQLALPDVERGASLLEAPLREAPRVEGYFPLTAATMPGAHVSIHGDPEAGRTSLLFVQVWYVPGSPPGGYTVQYEIVSMAEEAAAEALTVPALPPGVEWPATNLSDDYLLSRYAYVASSFPGAVGLRYVPVAP